MSSGDENGCRDSGTSPKILFGTTKSETDAALKSNSGLPRVLFGTASPPTAIGDSPRVMAGGEMRRRVECTSARLREIEPAATDAVVRRALRLVDATNLDDSYFDDVIRFGSGLQSTYGKVAEAQLALVSDADLAVIRRLGGDLLEHLDHLDPVAIFAPRRNVGRVLRAIAMREDPRRAFERRYAEISDIALKLRARLQNISSLADSIVSLRRKYASLEFGIEAHLLAARFLVQHIATCKYEDPTRESHYRSQSYALEVRVSSLSATASSVGMGRLMVGSIHDAVAGIERFASDLVNETLPAWHTAYSSALLAAASDQGAGEGLDLLRNLHTRLRNTLTAEGRL